MITSAVAAGNGYSALPVLVRDFYSQEVFRRALPRLRFLQFTKVRRDLQAVRGKNIVFTKFNGLTGGGAIAEDAVITPEALSASEITISVTEQANAVQVTEFLLKTSIMQVMEEASIQLANNFAKVLDIQLRTAALSTTNVQFGNETATLGAMTLAGSKFTAKTVRAAVELLATKDAPKIDGEFYVAFAHPHQLRALREDAEWIEAFKYMGRRNLYLGEAGMYEGVVFIETTNMPVLTNAEVIAKYGAGYVPATGYEAVFLADNSIAWGVALDVEIRDDGVTDFGRKHSLAWYGIWGSGLIENDYAVRVLTT